MEVVYIELHCIGTQIVRGSQKKGLGVKRREHSVLVYRQ